MSSGQRTSAIKGWRVHSPLANQDRLEKAADIVKLYGRRFTIEETFRDQKNLRFGMGLSATHIGTPERRDRLLLLAAIAHQLEFAGWRGTGVGTLDKGPTGPAFTSIVLSVELTVAAADVERARRLLDTAEKHCIISNALRVAVTVQAEIRWPLNTSD